MSNWRRRLGQAVILAGVLTTPAMAQTPTATPPRGLSRIEHIVVIYLENHSFDNLFGKFPGAEGLSKAGPYALQVDKAGQPYKVLPPVFNAASIPPRADLRFPADLPNQPFAIDAYMSPEMKTPDLVHRYYQQLAQIDGGKMDKFVAYTNAGGLVMGYQDGSKLALWKYAQRYTLADHFFHAAIGGSLLNHFWTICACTPRYENAPQGLHVQLDAQDQLVKDGALTPDGFVVNTIYTVYAPHPADTDAAQLLPPLTTRTIGDALSEKNISWAWYSGGWNDAVAGKPDRIFQYHHQPFAYFEKYGDGTAARREHLKDESDLVAELGRGTIPAVVFWKPIGEYNEHPGYTDTLDGDRHIAEFIEKIRKSPLWRSTAIIVTYDENGGFWDHVPPPKGDRWGPGIRVPTVIISPFAKRHYVDHTSYDTTSILKLIETRFDLAPLTERDAKANDLLNAFDFRPKH
jgi:phospholipase C